MDSKGPETTAEDRKVGAKRPVLLTKAQHKVLTIAQRDGGWIVAGKSEHGGHVEYHEPAAIMACMRRGWLHGGIPSPDGNIMGCITDAGRAALKDKDK